MPLTNARRMRLAHFYILIRGTVSEGLAWVNVPVTLARRQ